MNNVKKNDSTPERNVFVITRSLEQCKNKSNEEVIEYCLEGKVRDLQEKKRNFALRWCCVFEGTLHSNRNFLDPFATGGRHKKLR